MAVSIPQSLWASTTGSDVSTATESLSNATSPDMGCSIHGRTESGHSSPKPGLVTIHVIIPSVGDLGYGDVINSYWASALIVGAVLLIAAVALARQGLAGVSKAKQGVERAAASLGDDARWGKEELRAFKRELTA